MRIGKYQITRKAAAIALAAGGSLFLIGVAVMASRAGESAKAVSTFAVDRGPLTISVSERGSIRSRQQEVIKCQVEGQTTIIYLVDEGARVKKGDLLVELDSSKLQDQKVNQQIQVQNAEAGFIRARENLEVVRNQALADTAKAQLDAQFAGEDLRKYNEGDYPNELRQAENKITIANEELERATEKLRWTEVLYKEKYVSQTELQADRLSQKKTQLDLELAKGALQLLKEYTYKRKVDELKSNVEQTSMALERAKRKAAADLAQAEAELRAKESEYQRQQSQLAKTLRQIEACRMVAPSDGLVVYATTGQGGRNQEPLKEGMAVRERQDLIYLPTATDMMAEVKIHESNLNKVRVGLPVVLTVDALPGERFMARVSRIAPLPDGQSSWMNPDLKVYNTEINVDGDGSRLKTGMSCRAEIVVENYDDALHVPLPAVVREGGQTKVYVVKDGRPEARVVTLGLDNNDRVRIISGVAQGERVWTTPPIPTAADSAGNSVAAGIRVATTLAVMDASSSSAAGAKPTTRPAGTTTNRARWGDPEMRQRMQNMTPEQREEMRKRMMEQMTPEQRQQWEERRQRRENEGGGGADGNMGGGLGQGSRGPGMGGGRQRQEGQ